MKTAVMLFLLTIAGHAQSCGVEPTIPAPMTPVGFSRMVHGCVCNSIGQNCAWVWVAVKEAECAAPGGPEILSNPSMIAAQVAAQEQENEAKAQSARDQALQHEVLRALPGELIYWLATHETEARRIAALPGRDIPKALRDVETELKQQKAGKLR